MLNTEEIIKKLHHKAMMFGHYYKNEEWSRAKAAYDTARNVAVFVELEEREMIQLFGSRSYNDTEPPIEGEFKEKEVQIAYLECIKNNHTYELKPYPGKPEKKNSL
ncbi:MAG: hypothetical protein ACI4D2_06485 [Lachnospiraceae bacterium]